MRIDRSDGPRGICPAQWNPVSSGVGGCQYWGDDEKAEDAPDFFYKPEGIEIRWYKYAMRDAYSNIPLTKEKIIDILKKCAESAVKYGSST